MNYPKKKHPNFSRWKYRAPKHPHSAHCVELQGRKPQEPPCKHQKQLETGTINQNPTGSKSDILIRFDMKFWHELSTNMSEFKNLSWHDVENQKRIPTNTKFQHTIDIPRPTKKKSTNHQQSSFHQRHASWKVCSPTCGFTRAPWKFKWPMSRPRLVCTVSGEIPST